MYTLLLQDIDVSDQAAVDKFLLDLDGTKSKGKRFQFVRKFVTFQWYRGGTEQLHVSGVWGIFNLNLYQWFCNPSTWTIWMLG